MILDGNGRGTRAVGTKLSSVSDPGIDSASIRQTATTAGGLPAANGHVGNEESLLLAVRSGPRPLPLHAAAHCAPREFT